MSATTAFRPRPKSTVNLAATAATGFVAIPSPPSGEFQVRVHNAGSETAFVEFGAPGVLATLADAMPLPAGDIEVLTLRNDASGVANTMAAICLATKTTTVYVTVGEGF